MASKPLSTIDPHKPRDVLLMSNPQIADLHRFVWVGGTLYRWSNTEPNLVFRDGFTRNTGYDSLITHLQEGNAGGSKWLSCSLDRTATKEYGRYCYEMVLTHPHTKAIKANEAHVALTKHINPFFHQQEISVFKHITPTEVVAVWLPVANPVMQHDRRAYDGLLFEEEYERVTRQSYLDGHRG